MDILLIVIWIVLFGGWYFYQKIKRRQEELDQLGIPYIGMMEGYKSLFKLITLKESFIDLMMKNYKKFEDQQ